MRGKRWERISLWGGVAVPFIYYGNVAISGLFYPGYSHLTQYVSELGGPDAARPEIFNVTTVVLAGSWRAWGSAGRRRTQDLGFWRGA